jgi:hypothetical protein
MSGRRYYYFVLLAVVLAAGGCDGRRPMDLTACANLVATGLRPVATERTERFLGKLQEDTVRCRGGDKAVERHGLPWVDWQNYWATGDASSKAFGLDWLPSPNERGIRGALVDLEHQRIELIKFNLFDNSGTYKEYVEGREERGQKIAGPTVKEWKEMRLPRDSPERAEQERLAGILREVYGQHICDRNKIITSAQANDDGTPINDCLGHGDKTWVDNIEDVDTVVGWLAEPVRPHGFAISETQFQVFILNASRRLFSDRFFTSSFRPEFYTHLGVEWVTNNGPDGKVMEKGTPNGHEVEVSPLKRVLLRAIPELAQELEHVVNVFDPWARDRGEYYSLDWKPRPDAKSDPAFQ